LGKLVNYCFGMLTSTRVGIAVMVLVACLSLLGAVLPQGGDREAYVSLYGTVRGGLVWRLGFTDIFRTDYFTALLVVLCVMVFACSLRSLPRRMRLAHGEHFQSDPERIAVMPSSANLDLGVDAEEARLHVEDICRRRLYRVKRRPDGERSLLYATKMGFSRYGSSILHLSFIFLLIGGISMTRICRPRSCTGVHPRKDRRL
jgi:cytochrome c biogenesis protein